jgi:hypothetical protein
MSASSEICDPVKRKSPLFQGGPFRLTRHSAPAHRSSKPGIGCEPPSDPARREKFVGYFFLTGFFGAAFFFAMVAFNFGLDFAGAFFTGI